MSELKAKVKRFCDEYNIDFNGAQAAIRAGYAKGSAEVTASRLLTNANVISYLSGLKKVVAEKLNIDAENITSELNKIAYSNIQDYVGKDFKINDISELTREKAAAIASIKTKTVTFEGRTTTEVEFKLHNKVQSLELLGKHVGYFEKDNSQRIPTALEGSEFVIVRRKK